MNRHTILTAAVAAVAITSANAFAQNFTLQHTNSIPLTSLFNASSGYGNIPLSVAFDGTSAYVGGYNNTANPGNVGIVKISNVLSVAPSLAGEASTQVSATGRGYDALASDGIHVYALHDSGTASTSFIQKLDLSLANVWKTLDPNPGMRVMAMALDPVGDGTDKAVAFLSVNHGRRLALKDSDGSLLYTINGGANPGGVINPVPALPGTNWRGLAFDSAGNIALSEDSGFGYGVRVSPNQWSDLAGTANQTTRSVLKSVNVNNVGAGVAILEGLAPDPLLVFAPRAVGSGASTAVTLTDSLANVTNATSSDIHLKNRDGTATGLLQSVLRGNEDGIGNTFSTELKNFAVGKDDNGLPVLISVSALENRLDIYQMEPTYTGDADSSWSGGTWLANVVPNSPLLNARFAPTTAPRTITVAGQTTKNLKIDSPNSYTFTSSAILIDAPTGQNGNVQVLQGSHTIQSALNLAKTTVMSISTGAALTVTGAVVGAAGLSKTGVGTLDLVGATAINGPLGLTGGTLNVAGPVVGATRINASATSAAPATLNVTGSITLAQSGTDAATSRISADTTVTISPTGQIDLADNDAVFEYTNDSRIDSVRSLLLAGRANGAWNGTGGLASSSAANSNGATALAYAEASLLLGLTDTNTASFSGQTVDATTVLVKYTYAGDANLDGVINADDFALLDKGRANNVANAHWTDGDFTYDGQVTSADYLVIDTAYTKQTGTLSPSLLSSRAAEFGDSYVTQLLTAVPEPSTVLSACGLALLPLKRRRR